MHWDANLSRLRNVLAGLYPLTADAQRVVADAGLRSAAIAFDGKALNTWHNILTEALRQNRLNGLLQAALLDYGDNAELQQAGQAYLTNAAAPTPPAPASSQYHITIHNAQGLVIGDQAQPTQHYGPTVNTGGGAYVEGNVDTGGGDFVGRDQQLGKPAQTEQETHEAHQARQDLLAQHQRNLLKLQQKKAIYAAGEEPLSLLNQIEHEEQTIAQLKAKLDSTMSA